MDPTDPKSYFSAATPKGSGLDDEVAKLKLLQQQLMANRNGSPSRGPLLQQRSDLMNDVENAIYGSSKPSPTPKPTPAPTSKLFPVSYFT